ncbi:4Fe-4S dicluster domain-containing protein [Chloroflexota bacterium]
MKKVFIKDEFCMGCHLCEVYCQLRVSGTKDLLKAFKGKNGVRPIARLNIASEGNVDISIRCQHCTDAPCVEACLTGALSRDPVTGMVSLDEDRCMGCWTCVLTCRWGAVSQDKDKKRTVRCDLCHGEETPVCVAICPNEALVYVEVDDAETAVNREPAAAGAPNLLSKQGDSHE